MLNVIQEKLGTQVTTNWHTEMDDWADKVALYRDYAEGNHRAKMTSQMRAMLRITGDATDQMNANYCDMIIQAMADRLKVQRIEGMSDSATTWADMVLIENRFDSLQMDVHEACLRDGDTFVMVSYDNDKRLPELTHELAFDGVAGIIPVYDRMYKELICAIKIWYEGDQKRVNFYYADRVEKYNAGRYDDDTELIGTLILIETVPWAVGGMALGVPVFHFKNKSKARKLNGISELHDVIPLQDVLNRTIVSMVMTSELSAFQIRIARGFNPPVDMSPGMWVVIGGDQGLSTDQVADATVLPQGELVPFISQASFVVEQVATISRTPLPSMMGSSDASGEALKQRETGLLGKVQKFQIKIGNVWEDVIEMAAMLQNAFGITKAPPSDHWYCKWQDAQLRNEAQTIANAKQVMDVVGEREFLRLVSSVFGWDETKIAKIEAEKAAAQDKKLVAVGRMLPGFENLV